MLPVIRIAMALAIAVGLASIIGRLIRLRFPSAATRADSPPV
jgi:hypothetical protein